MTRRSWAGTGGLATGEWGYGSPASGALYSWRIDASTTPPHRRERNSGAEARQQKRPAEER